MTYAARQAAEQSARIDLLENHNEAQSKLLSLLMQLNGWSSIAPWLTDTIAAIRAGRPVDLDALDAAITSWQSEQSASTGEA